MSVKAINDFQYHVPEGLDEALALARMYGNQGKFIAGGTDLVPKLKGHVVSPSHIISLRHINELHFIQSEDEGLHFGAMTSIRELENCLAIRAQYAALYEGAHSIASTQIRNVGTIVGNICNAVPSADSAPALLVYNAQLRLISHAGIRTVPIGAFFTGVCKTVLRPDEIVQEVFLPKPAEQSRAVYYKFSQRKALDLAMVGVAANVQVKDGVFSDVRIGLGAVSVTPKRAAKAEQMLLGQKVTMHNIEEAARYAATVDCSPITDLRATKEYRVEMVRVLTRNALCVCSGLQGNKEVLP